MTPVGSQGPLGYADYQRIVNWDGPIFYKSFFGEGRVGSVTTGVMESSRYGYLMGMTKALLAPVVMTIAWYAEQKAFTAIGTRVLVLDEQIAGSMFLHVPILGPWMGITWAPKEALTEWQLGAVLFLSNRINVVEAIPHGPTLFYNTGIIKEKATLTFYPSSYYAGPAQAYIVATSAEMQLIFEFETEFFTWEEFFFYPGIAKTGTPKNLILPNGTWRMKLVNTGVESTYRLVVIPSLTGSS